MSAPAVDIAQLVERSRAAQGLPPRVEDATTISRIVTLVKAGGQR